MQCISLVTQGNNTNVRIDATGTNGTCPAYVLLSQADYSTLTLANVSTSEPITSAQVQAVFGWGFGVVLLFWSLGYAIGAAKMAISKL